MKAAVCFLFFVSLARGASGSGYMGRNVCAGCHKDIAATQARTAMARTWQGTETKQLPANYSEAYAEGPDPAIDYLIRRKAQDFECLRRRWSKGAICTLCSGGSIVALGWFPAGEAHHLRPCLREGADAELREEMPRLPRRPACPRHASGKRGEL